MSWNNKVELIGSLGADPEMRYSQSGVPILSFRMATSEKWKDKVTGAQKEETEWSSVVCFGDRATEYAAHLRKGSYVRVEGKLKTEMYEKDGVKHYPTKIHASIISPAAFPRTHDTTPAPAHAYATGNPIPFGAPPNAEQAMAQYGDFQY